MSRTTLRILVAGEGPNELGALFGRSGVDVDHPAEDAAGQGVIQALLCKIRPSGWMIHRAYVWKDIRKLRVGRGPSGEGDYENARRVILIARERGCHAAVFLRDRDGRMERQRQIERAVMEASGEGSKLKIAAGVAVEQLESWLCALAGIMGSESLEDAVRTLEARCGIAGKSTTAMVQHAMNHDGKKVAPDARSYLEWRRMAARALNVKVPAGW